MQENENSGALAGATGADVLGTLCEVTDTLELSPETVAFLDAVVKLPPEDRLPVLEIAVDHYRAGQPIPPLISYMDEARTWAALANRSELKAYCAASFARLSPADQAAFLSFAQQRAAA